jgi:hypothetical protein
MIHSLPDAVCFGIHSCDLFFQQQNKPLYLSLQFKSRNQLKKPLFIERLANNVEMEIT